jgi:DNA-directed RNA polymerase specialized sigma24 family protein
MLGYFRFSSEEAAEFSPQVISEIERRLPEWLKSMTLMGILPLIQRRGRKFYLLMGVPFSDADELASKLVENVLHGLSKAFPRGNVGAWIATIQRHVLMDYWRMKGRERRHLGIRQDADSLADVRDVSVDEAALQRLIEDLPAASREIVERRLEGAEWTEIAVHHQKTVNDLKKSVQSMIWPEGSLPLRKKRRRRGRPDA